jgi:hypothetical protein
VFLADVTEFFSLRDLPGHLSYLLIAISYLLTRMFWLRVIAVAGLALEIGYFSLSGGDLRTGIAWDMIFILINLYQLYWLVRERMMSRLPEAYRDVLRAAMKGLDDAGIFRLLSAGDFTGLEDGAVLAAENEDLDRLYFICDGRVRVAIGGRQAGTMGNGSFIGEVAFMTGKPATATVTAAGPVKALVFDRARLSEFLRREEQLAGTFHQLLGRDLAHKLQSSNSQLAACHVRGPAA